MDAGKKPGVLEPIIFKFCPNTIIFWSTVPSKISTYIFGHYTVGQKSWTPQIRESNFSSVVMTERVLNLFSPIKNELPKSGRLSVCYGEQLKSYVLQYKHIKRPVAKFSTFFNIQTFGNSHTIREIELGSNFRYKFLVLYFYFHDFRIF